MAGNEAPAPPKNSVGSNWYTIVFPDEMKREKVVQQLKQLGAQIVKEADYFVTSNPSGNQIYLVL